MSWYSSLLGGGGLSAYSSAAQGASSSGGWANWLNTASNYASTAATVYNAYQGTQSGGAQQSGSGVNWSQALLSGLGSAADAYMGDKMDEKAVARAGFEARKTRSYEASLADYYQQKNKARKRTALDTYGQFSLTSRYAPNMTAAPPVQVPTEPQPGA